MIRSNTTPDGNTAFTCTVQDLKAVTTWARSMCHLAFGPEKGEQHFRRLPAKGVLSLWANEECPDVSALPGEPLVDA
jgi:hypothetical protein